MLSKIIDKAHCLFEEMSANNCQWPDEWSMAKKVADIHEVDSIVSFSAQVSTLANHIVAFTTKESSSKEAAMVTTTSYMGEGVGVEQEQCQFMNNRNFNYRPNNLPTHYHLGLRNHENFSYANPRNAMQPPPSFQQPGRRRSPPLKTF